MSNLQKLTVCIQNELKELLASQNLKVIPASADFADIEDHAIYFRNEVGDASVVSIQVPSLGGGLDECSISIAHVNTEKLDDAWTFAIYVGVQPDYSGFTIDKLKKALKDNNGKFDLSEGVRKNVVTHPVLKKAYDATIEISSDQGMDLETKFFNNLTEGKECEGFSITTPAGELTIESHPGQAVVKDGADKKSFRIFGGQLEEFKTHIASYLLPTHKL